MNYASIRTCDIANGEGVRVSLFVSGCTHHCKGCFNPDQWDFNYGEPFTPKVEDEILAALEPSFISGLTILGGEPMEPENQRALVPFLRRIESFKVKVGSNRALLESDMARMGDVETLSAPEKTLSAPEEALAATEEALAVPEKALAATEEALAAPEKTLAGPEKTLAGPKKTLWVYTGCLLDELKDPASRWRTEVTDEFLSMIDVLVDGPFVEELKDISLQFRGSSNQRILRLKDGKISLSDS